MTKAADACVAIITKYVRRIADDIFTVLHSDIRARGSSRVCMGKEYEMTDIAVTDNCKNPDSYGEICVKCNKCGRFGEQKMTRAEAIEILKQFKTCLSDVVFDERGSEAWQMAISALEQEPCVTSTDEPMTMVYPTIFCEDAISREAVIEWLKAKDIIKMSWQEENARKELSDLPSVQPSHKGQTVCDLCKFNPPSSADGKPCTMCPAETI